MRAIVTTDLGFGDSGKGTIVDWLVREHKSKLVVRYNGGAQAFHTVYDGKTGLKHIFRQYGSGMFSGAKTIIGPEVVINPLTMMREAGELDALGLNTHGTMLVSEDALITTPYHSATNRIRETLRTSRHGSTGMGIGETRRLALANPNMAIRAKDCSPLPSRQSELKEKLEYTRQVLYEDVQNMLRNASSDVTKLLDPELQVLEDRHPYYNQRINLVEEYLKWYLLTGVMPTADLENIVYGEQNPVIFEAAQGVLLDKRHGFHPHTTWSDTTPRPVLDLLPLSQRSSDLEVIGISRTYATRHGAGPLVTEGLVSRDLINDDDNPVGALQGGMRVGALDLETLKYALSVCDLVGMPVTKLAFTHCDKLETDSTWPVCHSYIGGPDIPLSAYHCIEEASKESSQFTALLDMAKPEIIQHKTYRVLDDISSELQVPIMVKSFGKTNNHKLKLC